MAYNQTPQKFGFHRIVAMYYAVAWVDHSFSIWQWEITLDFKNTVYGLPHYLRFSLNGTSSQIVLFKDIITHRIALKIAFNFLNGTFDIVNINGDIIIHISTVFSCQPMP